MERVLSEKEAEEFLEKNGFNVIRRQFAENKNQLSKINIEFPWAMKISSRKILHKAKIGGVILNIKNLNQAEQAFTKLSKIKDFEEVLIQPMIKGENLILGLKKTPEFDEVIMFGHGGSNVEKEKDVSFRIVPLTEKDAEEMIKEIKFYKKLKKSRINFKAIKQNIIQLSKLAEKHKEIKELDINPLSVSTNEAVVIDARVVSEKITGLRYLSHLWEILFVK